MKQSDDSRIDKEESRLSITEVLLSVLAAMFGVQNGDRHQRDFERGDPMQFIVIGILFVLAFILILMWIVDLILQG